MPQEIERKYLVRLEHWKPTTAGVLYRQGYLSSVKERVVRVRIAPRGLGVQDCHGSRRPPVVFVDLRLEWFPWGV